MYFGDELVDRSKRLFEHRFDLVPSHHFVAVDLRAEHVAGGRHVGRHGALLTFEAERGQSEQDQEADMRQRVCDELGRRTANGVSDLSAPSQTLIPFTSERKRTHTGVAVVHPSPLHLRL